DARLRDEVTEMREWSRRAVELEPYFADANSMLAWTEALAPEVDQYGVATIEQLYLRIRKSLPVDDVVMALAVALWRAGDVATARELCTQLKAAALGTKQSREMASALLERIGPVTFGSP